MISIPEEPVKLTTDQIARICHEANRALQLTLHEDVNPPWDVCTTSFKDSVRDGVMNAKDGHWPREMHEDWCQFKLNQGWTYGEKKDFGAKTHPNLVPYEELPEEQKRKDDLFVSIVRVLS